MTLRAAIVKVGTTLTSQNFTTAAAIPFNTEVLDTDALHDAGATTRLTIPQGTTRIKLIGVVSLSSYVTGDDTTLEFRKNGSAMTAPPIITKQAANPSTAPNFIMESPVLVVVPTDYFEFFLQSETDTSFSIVQDETWFGIIDVDTEERNTFSGCSVKMSANQTTANYSAFASVPFDTEIVDVGGWHSTVTNNSRMTIPAGVNYVEILAQVSASLITANEANELRITKNGSAIDPALLIHTAEAATTFCRQIYAPVVPCTAGDYFEVQLKMLTDTSISVLAAETFFTVRKLG